MFSDVTIWELWKVLAIPTFQTDSSDIVCKVDAQLVLLKFADGMIHEGDAKDLEGLNLGYFISTMTDLVKVMAAPLFVEPDSFSMEEISGITSSIRLHLDIFELGLNTSTNPLTAADSSKLAETLVGRIYVSVLLTADFLQLLHLHIPIQGLTGPSATTATPLPLPISDLFKGIKRDVITILTQLLHLDKQLQNTIREKGGIVVVLAQCNIDDDNPCMSVSYEIDH
jgi:hypothetical protein